MQKDSQAEGDETIDLDRVVVVLGTGGTIAGSAASAADNVGYIAAQTGVGQLLGALGGGVGRLDAEQVAQVDSKDMDFALWQRLAGRVVHHLQRPEVAGLVITHGTDTLEETAYFLHRTLAPAKPVVITGAMRPGTSLQADGPQNLADAIAVARVPSARGVLVAMAGSVHRGAEVRKVHAYRLDAFSSGDAGPLGRVEEGRLRQLRDWPDEPRLGTHVLAIDPARWPRVAIVTAGAGAGAWMVEALRSAEVKGIVVAATGNGTLHHALEAALLAGQASGVAVLRSTRCQEGRIVPGGRRSGDVLPSAGALTPVQARIELMLQLLAGPGAA
jgi:L-asparaginase